MSVELEMVIQAARSAGLTLVSSFPESLGASPIVRLDHHSWDSYWATSIGCGALRCYVEEYAFHFELESQVLSEEFGLAPGEVAQCLHDDVPNAADRNGQAYGISACWFADGVAHMKETRAKWHVELMQQMNEACEARNSADIFALGAQLESEVRDRAKQLREHPDWSRRLRLYEAEVLMAEMWPDASAGERQHAWRLARDPTSPLSRVSLAYANRRPV